MKTRRILALLLCGVMLAAVLPAAAEETPAPEGPAMAEVPEYASGLEHRSLPDADAAIAFAKDVWGMDYLAAGDLSAARWFARATENGHWLVTAATDGADPALYLDADTDGFVYALMNLASGYTGAYETNDAIYDGDAELTLTAWRDKISFMTERFIETLDPGETDAYRAAYPNGHATGMCYTYYSCTLQYGEDRFVVAYSDPKPDREYRNKFIIQTAPVIRVVCFDSYTNASEGGNG